MGISRSPVTGVGRVHATQRCPPAAGASPPCHWQFQRYIPSELEAKWWAAVDEVGSQPCVAAESTRFREYFQIYLDVIAQNNMTVPDRVEPYGGCSCEKNNESVTFDPRVFSRFEYVNSCSNEVHYSFIEPLAGILRHPAACPGPNKDITIGQWSARVVRKDWLVVDQWWLHKSSHAAQKFFYFDAGASTWTAGAGGASQAWFDSVWANKCATFDGYWMWEVTPHPASDVFRDVPDHVKPHYRWFNIPAAVEHTSSDSPLFHIMQTARKEDYVVFKLDIDNNPVEEGIVKELLAYPELMELIDEFFWEHHINMHPMTIAWQDQISKSATQRDSIAFFRTLREHGVRAHSWV